MRVRSAHAITLFVVIVLSLELAGGDDGSDRDGSEPSTWSCQKYPLLCHSTCRCLPGDACFPDEAYWSSFDQRLKGRLLHVRPPAQPCYDLSSTDAECLDVVNNWENSKWRSHQAGASEHPNWESYGNETCILPRGSNEFSACKQGSVPRYAVNVSSVGDIQDALEFAKTFNLRVVIKNTGHDYLGRSSGHGSLSIWVHHLKSIEFNNQFEAHFGGSQARSQVVTVVTVGAGVQTMELLQAAHKKGVVVVTPFSTSVGPAGGYFQGGGHGVLSPTYGLAADTVVEVTMVTPDGKLRTLNRRKNPELFWGIRGGGGGTFGIVMNVTLLTFPAPRTFLEAVYVISAADSSSFANLLQEFVKLSPKLTDLGWAGYFTTLSNLLVMRYVVPDRDYSFARTTFGPIIDFVQTSASLGILTKNLTSYASYIEFFNNSMCAFYGNNGCIDRVGINRALTTRLIPRSTFLENPSQLAAALISLMESNATTGAILGIHVGGGAVGVQNDNSVNEAWREAIWHVTAEADWNDTANATQIMSGLTTANTPLRELTPSSGVYNNEADYNEPNWQQSIFGDNYPRLRALKDQVDPYRLLTCHHCVGSESAPTAGCGSMIN